MQHITNPQRKIMNVYAPSQEPDTERALLLTAKVGEYTPEFANIIAVVVRRAKRDTVNPKTNRMEYFDGSEHDADVGFRNCTWVSGRASAMYVEDLHIECQLDRKSEDPKLYAHNHLFRPHRVERAHADHMLSTFKRLDKGMEKIKSELGCVDSEDFAGYLLRLAKVMGIKTFIYYREGKTTGNLAQSFHECSAHMLGGVIEKMKLDACM